MSPEEELEAIRQELSFEALAVPSLVRKVELLRCERDALREQRLAAWYPISKATEKNVCKLMDLYFNRTIAAEERADAAEKALGEKD